MVDLAQLIYAIQEAPNILLKKSEELEFVGHCLANANDTKSQNYQDIFALYESKFKKNGFFVEFGATDGDAISNTNLLEKKYGWKGILAEPNPVYHEALYKNRNCNISRNCVYSVTGEPIEFIAAETSDISGIKEFANKDEHAENRKNGKTISVMTISLLHLLTEYDAPKEIDYLSIDTEGSEYHILEAFFKDTRGYNIRTMTVEHNYVLEEREKIFDLLTKNGYKRKFAMFSRWDDFYVKVN